MAKGKIRVFINLMRLFEWDKPRIPDLPNDPTPERLLQFLCTPGLPSDFGAFKVRYREISAKDQDLFTSILEPELIDNLFWPLRHGKTSYLVGNYVGTIALCGLVAEKMAILIHALHTPGEGDREKFERQEQARRVAQLKTRQLITSDSVQDFGTIRAARKNYLHYWNSGPNRAATDARQAYAAAVRLVPAAMGLGVSDGTITVPAQLAAYLKARGAYTSGEKE